MVTRLRDVLRAVLRTPRQRRAEAAYQAYLDTVLWQHRQRSVEMAVPRSVRGSDWTGYPCPQCDAEPVGGWKWYTDADTWSERLHLLLRCNLHHTWTIDTDMG